MPATRTPSQTVSAALKEFTPEIAAIGRKARAKLQKLLPGALELVYDNYNFFVIGYGPSERASEAIFSIAMHARGVALCFLQGAGLRDPHKLLRGSGNVVRSIRLPSADILDEPPVRALIKAAIHTAAVPLDPRQKRRLIIKSISKKRRPRRPEPVAASGQKKTVRKR
jgi:hypothetical protein